MYGYRHRDGGIMLVTPTAHRSHDAVIRQDGWERAPEYDEATATDRRTARQAAGR